MLLPKVSRALVLSEGTLHPLSLPGLEPLPSNSIGAVRGVVSVALNDDELDLAGKEGEGVTDMTVVLVKRKGLGIYRLGQRMTMVKVGFVAHCGKLTGRKSPCQLHHGITLSSRRTCVRRYLPRTRD